MILLMIAGLYFEIQADPCQPVPWRIAVFSSRWHPFRGEFGFLPFIMGTLWVTGVAVLIAVPLCLLTAIYLSEYAHSRAPRMGQTADRHSGRHPLGGVRGLGHPGDRAVHQGSRGAPFFGVFSTGYSVLAGGIVLAIMIFPVIIHVVPGDFPRRAPGGPRGVTGPGRHPLADHQARRHAQSPARGGRRRRPGHFPGLRRDHGRADGGRQCAAKSPIPSWIPPIRCRR